VIPAKTTRDCSPRRLWPSTSAKPALATSSCARSAKARCGAKASTDKASRGGRKAAFRTREDGTATRELIAVSDGYEQVDTPDEHAGARPLQVTLVSHGEADTAHLGRAGVRAARRHHAQVRAELPVRALALSKSDPAIPTVYVDAVE
jgi:nicotinate phosphoribosyltransferase